MKHKLLVPVGDFPSLIMAINNGADEVYLGGKKFGARAYASNFTIEEIENATKLCHLYGVKIYITVNTLVYDKEIDVVVAYIDKLHQIGVDALIMQDVGLINLTHQMFPNLEIHASTQMHNHNEDSLAFLEKLGVKRVVFARELPLDYINNIKTNLEKEVFIHGSLCISYSGQCLFSSAILGRSGNRGECAGMCRLPYKLYENDKLIKTEGDYLLSPKDLCSISNFKKLMESNVVSFKIEGRMKSPAYVGIVTKIYKTLMNQYENGEELKVNPEDLFLLNAIFNREYTSGHLFNDNNLMNIKAPNNLGISVGMVTEVTKKKIKIKLTHSLKQFEGIRFKNSNKGLILNFIYDENNNLIKGSEKDKYIYLDNTINLLEKDEVMLTLPLVKIDEEVTKKIPIRIFIEAKINAYLKLKVSDNIHTLDLTTDYLVQESINSPTTKERIITILNKVGNTPFTVQKVDLNIDDNIFIPVGRLNEFRRNILGKLQDARMNSKVVYEKHHYQIPNKKETKSVGLSVLVRTKEQLQACFKKNVENIIVFNKNLMNDNLIYRIPRDNLKYQDNYPNILATDLASLDKYRTRGDYFLNITNHYTLDYLTNYGNIFCLSPECTIDNIKDIVNNTSNKEAIEVYLYGNIELMIMKYCLVNELVNKDKLCSLCTKNNNYYLKDRNNALYKIETNIINHSNTILNTNKTNYLDKLAILKEMGIKNFRIELLDEDYNETIKLIERVNKDE